MAARSSRVRVVIDLGHIRRNVQDVAGLTGVPVIAVIKADAYGLGANRVAPAIADLVDSFCLFSPEEAREIDLWRRTGKPAMTIGPPVWSDAQQYLDQHVRPAVSTIEQARLLRAARPILCVDTGQQRFACPPEHIAAALCEGGCDEAFTHATSLAQVQLFRAAVAGKVARLHASGSSLLREPPARLDAVRPGMALYQGAVRVSTQLVEVHKNTGPAGYSGFVVPRHGVILCGYSNGLRAGPCLVNGRPSRLIEVGMQTAFVELSPDDKPGDEVVLLGDGVTEQQMAAHWGTGPQECLCRLAGTGVREYR